jgi:hypothetical protein
MSFRVVGGMEIPNGLNTVKAWKVYFGSIVRY